MPARRVSDREREIRELIRPGNKKYLTQADVQRITGMNPASTREWLSDVPGTMFGTRRRWAIDEVARKLYENTEVAI